MTCKCSESSNEYEEGTFERVNLRQFCLDKALEVHGGHANNDVVLRTAKQFEDYVIGKVS